MIFVSKRKWLLTIAAHAGALFLAAGAAYAFSNSSNARAAYGANHCTRYAPPYSQDTGCLNRGTLVTSFYQTTGHALRDSNVISVDNNRWIHVWYGEYPGATTYGTYLSIGASLGSQRAECKVDNSSVRGRDDLLAQLSKMKIDERFSAARLASSVRAAANPFAGGPGEPKR
jgi:hypothetical protein